MAGSNVALEVTSNDEDGSVMVKGEGWATGISFRIATLRLQMTINVEFFSLKLEWNLLLRG